MRRLLVFLVILALVLVGADMAARSLAQKALASQLTLAAGLHEKPQVTVHGFPFLNQVVSGHYQHVTLSAAQVPLDADLTADEVTAEARDLTLPLSELSRLENVSVTAGSLEVSAQLGYATLGKAVTSQIGKSRFTFEVSYRDSKTVHVVGTTTVLGTEVTAGADATVLLDGTDLVINFATPLFGNLPSAVSSRVVAIRMVTIPFDLPYSLTADDLSVTPQGVTVTAKGSQVVLTSP